MKEFNSNGSTSKMPKNQEEVFDYSKVNKSNISNVINVLEKMREQFAKEQLDNLPNVAKELISNGKDENYNYLINNLTDDKVVSIKCTDAYLYAHKLFGYELSRCWDYEKQFESKYVEILAELTNSNVKYRRNLHRYDFSLNK